VEQLWLVAEAIKLAFSGSGEGQSSRVCQRYLRWTKVNRIQPFHRLYEMIVVFRATVRLQLPLLTDNDVWCAVRCPPRHVAFLD